MEKTQEPKKEEVSMIDRAEAAALKLNESLERFEKIIARQLVTGRTEFSPPEQKEETNKEYAARVMRGEFNEKTK